MSTYCIENTPLLGQNGRVNLRIALLLFIAIFIGNSTPVEFVNLSEISSSYISAKSVLQINPVLEGSSVLRNLHPAEKKQIVYDLAESGSLIVASFYSSWSLQEDLGLRSVQRYELPRSRAPPIFLS